MPIEHAVIKDTGLNRHEMAPLDLRAKCRDYALARVEEQKKDFIRLGVLGDWDHPYLTLQENRKSLRSASSRVTRKATSTKA